MARKFLVSIDHNKLESLQFRLQNLATAPSSPGVGQSYFDTVLGAAYTWNGTAWVPSDASKVAAGSIPNTALTTNPLARANHTGTQTAATISDFDAQVRTSRLDQMAAPTADVALNGRKITGLADGTSATDAVTKQQLDAVSQGRDFKDSVRVASTANVTISAPGTAIDGVTLSNGDRVLLKNQTTASQNGIYVFNGSAAAMTRATDADTAAKLTANTTVMVEEGTANADTQWTMTTNGAITIGTTSLAFVQTGAGTTYTQGTGISISGGVIAVDSTVARKYSATVGDGSATSIAITHSLGTQDVHVQVRDASTNAIVEVDWVATSTTVVTLTFAVAPASNAYRVVVIG
ncbi:hypothetical protein H4CHR_02994 [Variovorax sp. PBS-H4]|uniref:hypothetical protein n=1 Tax=Variovorax sp. PBS-H4 TaxID=434008 RepID=UPI001319A3EC|nr:hypothetical protein [Variovorax sp. PBS-H4]VTU32353.1 hypothetical protein H4CHR_02994 [Variovorax sp. PBS-H4]